MTRQAACAWALAALLAATTAHADLIKIGTATYDDGSGEGEYNLIYEGELGTPGLVWLDYTKNQMAWQTQINWVTSTLPTKLTVNLDPVYTTDINWTAGWRLPATDETQANLTGPWAEGPGYGYGFGYSGPDASGYHDYYRGYNMLNSEMGHLYYESLAGIGQHHTDGTRPNPYGLEDTYPFENLKTDNWYYWSQTKYSGDEYDSDYDMTWCFNFVTGYQCVWPANTGIYALAVHEGTVSVVPVPGAGVLGLIGMATAGWLKRRRAL